MSGHYGPLSGNIEEQMRTTLEWLPRAGDVHLRIWLDDVAFDYAVAVTAVPNVIHDWNERHWCTIELIDNDAEKCPSLPRLPCERLFLGDPTP